MTTILDPKRRRLKTFPYFSENWTKRARWWFRPFTFTLRAFSRRFCPKRLHTYIHTLMAWWLTWKVPTSTSGAVWGFSILPRDTLTAKQGDRTSNLPITRSWLYPWSSATPTYLLCHMKTKLIVIYFAILFHFFKIQLCLLIKVW